MKRMTLKMMAEDFGKTALNLGRADENKAVRIEIDLSNLLEITPDANASVTVETPSGKKYPATTSKEGKLLIWDVNSADTAEEGRGWAQLTITGSNDEVLKSVVTATRVGRSIRGEGTAPDPVQNWVDDATSKLGNVVSAGENAKEAAEKAEEAAKRANDAAEKAENGGGVQSDYAQNAATQPDYIKNRPGGYYQTVPTINIQWDGVVGDKPNTTNNKNVLVKASDEILTADRVIGATVVSVRGAESQSMILSEDRIMSGDGFVMETHGAIISCSKTTFEIDGLPLTLPETGTYFAYREQGGNKMYVSSLTKPETQELVPIPGELTNIKGGYDIPSKTEELLNQTVTPEQWNNGNTNVTLKVAMVKGASVTGTAGGVEVHGTVSKNGQYLLVELMSDKNEELYALKSDGYLEYIQGTAPTTDVSFALTQTIGTHPKVIPAEYLDVDLSSVQNQINEMQMAMNDMPAKTNPVFRGSFSQNRAEGTVIGGSSHVEGFGCTASGLRSHAEGHDCQATNDDAHAEGNGCTASGMRSHAEGMECIAAGKDQHVQGRGNIEDGANKYAHIVGNGLGYSRRSNAHTLDWSGVPWYQGRPQFGGTAQDNGSQTVMANGDKEIILASSTVGSTKKFKITVDDTGTLSATKVTS